MSAFLVDSNVLLDIVTDDPQWADWSAEQVARHADIGALVINPIIYAEVSAGFQRIEELNEVLDPRLFVREPLPYEAGFLAGKAFLAYRQRGGSRTAILPDFYIGAHAAIAGMTLITRDARRYRTAYPSLPLIAPA